MWEMEGDGGGWRGEGRSKQERKYCAFKGMFVREHACIQTTNKTAGTHARTHAPHTAKLLSAPDPVQPSLLQFVFWASSPSSLSIPPPSATPHRSAIRSCAARGRRASGGTSFRPPSPPSSLPASRAGWAARVCVSASELAGPTTTGGRGVLPLWFMARDVCVVACHLSSPPPTM